MRTNVSRALIAALPIVLALSCRKSDPAPPPPEHAAVASASASPAGPPPASAASPEHPQHPAERLLMTWNAALDRRDPAPLASLYGPQVLFYGQRKSASEVLDAKRTALAKAPDYRQRVENVHIGKAPKGFVVRFDKHSGAGAASTVPARLVLESTPGGLRIVEESDAVTDARLRRPVSASCSEAVMGVVTGNSVIRADIERVAKEMPEAHPGGLTYDADERNVDAAFGYMLPERFDPRWWIKVVSGKMSVKDALTDESLHFSPEEEARVRDACGGGAGDADSGR